MASRTGITIKYNGQTIGRGPGAVSKAFDRFMGRKVLTKEMQEMIGNTGVKSNLSKVLQEELRMALAEIKENIKNRYVSASHTIWKTDINGYPVAKIGSGAHTGPSPWSDKGTDLKTALEEMEILINRSNKADKGLQFEATFDFEHLDETSLGRSGYWENTLAYRYWLTQEFGGRMFKTNHTFSGKHFILSSKEKLHPNDNAILDKLQRKVATIVRSRLKKR